MLGKKEKLYCKNQKNTKKRKKLQKKVIKSPKKFQKSILCLICNSRDLADSSKKKN